VKWWSGFLLCLALAPTAAAAPERFVDTRNPLVTDGRHQAAYVSEDWNTLVIQHDSGRVRRLAIPCVGGISDAHRRMFLVDCGRAAYLALPGRDKLRAVAGQGRTWFPESYYPREYLTDVGRYWAAGLSGERGKEWFYVNWRTGQRRSFGEYWPDEWSGRDLDTRNLRRFRPRSGPRLRSQGRRVLLDRPGRPSVVLYRCSGRCGLGLLSAGLASWNGYRRASAYDLATGRRYQWDFESPLDPYYPTQHTRRWIYFNVERWKPGERIGTAIQRVRRPG
jgi:hypothetical protein